MTTRVYKNKTPRYDGSNGTAEDEYGRLGLGRHVPKLPVYHTSDHQHQDEWMCDTVPFRHCGYIPPWNQTGLYAHPNGIDLDGDNNTATVGRYAVQVSAGMF